MKVSIVKYDDLPEDKKERASNNGCGKKYANYLRIEWDEENIEYHSDAVEPEDATFTRDFYWIKEALLLAFNEGSKYASMTEK